MTTKPVGDESLEDRLTESIWAISDGAHPAKDVLRQLIRGILSAGPVGGAGELTAAIERLECEAAAHLDLPDNQFARDIEAVCIALRAALAAKAPQGVPIRNEDEIRERYGDAAVEMLRRHHAQPGHENCFVILGDLHAAEKGLDNIICNPATLPVPHSLVPKLPAASPVSDDTIHHGMVPPRPAYMGHKLLQLTCNHERSTDTASCECGWQKEFATCGGAFDGWLKHASQREAAAPKPAPDATSCNASPVETEEGAGSATRHAKSPSSAQDQPTRAPGAERPMLEDLPHKIANRILTDDHGSSYYKWGLGEIERLVREALVAAPPAADDTRIAKVAADTAVEYLKERETLLARMADLNRALQQIADSACSCGSTDDPNWHGEHCLKAIALRALPPSTGEKQ